jgi:SAM-dependent methyltransferase
VRMLAALRQHLPPSRRAQLLRLRRPAFPGNFRRTQPLSERYGFDRGTPVDRYYIDVFLEAHRADIRGRVLEVKNSSYSRRFGADAQRFDVLDIDPTNPDATVVADLSAADDIAADQFDAFVLTQTLHLIFDIQAAIHHACRLLKPGGVLLATLPSISRIDRGLPEQDYWRVTRPSCRALFGGVFGQDNVTLSVYGNVFTATAFLMGLAAEELRAQELAVHDPAFPVVIGVRAVKR